MNTKSLALGLVALAVIAGAVVFGMNNKSTTSSQTPTAAPTQTVAKDVSPTTTTTADADSTYTNGTYTAEGEYVSPGGPETVTVTMTLEDGIVSDVTFVGNADRPLSVRYQGMFAEGYKTLVVGKNIDEVKLDKVSGSSLTPKGFNDAVAKIKEEAQA